MDNDSFAGVKKFLFVTVFLLGATGIIFLKLRDWSPFQVTAFPVVLMIVYAMWLSFFDSLHKDIAGENLYYLGFLYTLTSLGLSLYQFVELDGTQAIISNFGIALSTTIVGVLFRVVFQQMQEDPLRVEGEARMELGEAARRLKVEIYQSIVAFNSFRRATVQSVDEGVQEIRERLTQNFEEVAQANMRLTQKMEETTTVLSEYAGMMGRINTRNTTAIDQTVTALETLSRRIEQIETPSDLLEKKLSPLIAELMRVVQQSVDRAEKEVDRLKPLGELIDATAQSSNALTLQVEKFFQTLSRDREEYQESVDRHVSQFQGAIAAFHKASEADRDRFQHDVGDSLAQIKDAIQDLQTMSSRVFTDWSEGTERHLGQIDQLMRAIKPAGSGLIRSWEEGQSAIHALVSNAEQDLAVVREHRKALKAELEKSRELVGTVHSSLASMTTLIVERLNGN